MDVRRAKEILTILADGINPITGEILPDGDCCNQAEVVRTLHTAIHVLDKPARREGRQPRNAGTPWMEEEMGKLVDEHDTGMSIAEMAKEHGRSRGAITSRLASLGLIDQPYFAKKNR